MQPNALPLADQVQIVFSFSLDKNGLTPVGTPTFDEWIAVGFFIKDAEQSVQFWIGDWLLYGEKAYGKTQYEQAVAETRLAYSTLRDYKWVARAVPVERRTEKLSFYHHREVANLPRSTQHSLLTRAEQEHWPLLKLKQEKFRLRATPPPVSPPDLVNSGFLLGDCLSHIATIPDASLDLLVTDPPYGIDYASEHREVNPMPKIVNDRFDETVAVLDRSLALLFSKLKGQSHVYLFTSWKTYPLLRSVIARYFTIHNLLIWVKNNWTAGDLDANYGQIHECIVFAQKGARPLNGPAERDLLRFARVSENGRMHPTEKPLPLLEYLIEKSSLPGEVVCDPFAGVASTLVAAKNKRRKYLGIEIDPNWYRYGQARLQALETV